MVKMCGAGVTLACSIRRAVLAQLLGVSGDIRSPYTLVKSLVQLPCTVPFCWRSCKAASAKHKPVTLVTSLEGCTKVRFRKVCCRLHETLTFDSKCVFYHSARGVPPLPLYAPWGDPFGDQFCLLSLFVVSKKQLENTRSTKSRKMIKYAPEGYPKSSKINEKLVSKPGHEQSSEIN